MAEFPVNPTRFDPYKNFKFRVRWDDKYVAGVSKISALKRTTEVIEHREGGDPSTSRKSPGRTQFDPITLERGLTQDHAFEQWANKVWTLGAGSGPEVSLKDFRKDIVIEIYNEAGQLTYATIDGKRHNILCFIGQSVLRKHAQDLQRSEPPWAPLAHV